MIKCKCFLNDSPFGRREAWKIVAIVHVPVTTYAMRFLIVRIRPELKTVYTVIRIFGSNIVTIFNVDNLEIKIRDLCQNIIYIYLNTKILKRYWVIKTRN